MIAAGKSMGGRIASQVAAKGGFDPPPAALVFFGYPLHPPNQPAKRRDEHLPRVTAPMLFLHGTRDPFGSPDEMRELVASLPGATLQLIDGGDHSLVVKRKNETGLRRAGGRHRGGLDQGARAPREDQLRELPPLGEESDPRVGRAGRDLARQRPRVPGRLRERLQMPPPGAASCRRCCCGLARCSSPPASSSSLPTTGTRWAASPSSASSKACWPRRLARRGLRAPTRSRARRRCFSPVCSRARCWHSSDRPIRPERIPSSCLRGGRC